MTKHCKDCVTHGCNAPSDQFTEGYRAAFEGMQLLVDEAASKSFKLGFDSGVSATTTEYKMTLETVPNIRNKLLKHIEIYKLIGRKKIC